jgi:hypothetical protein
MGNTESGLKSGGLVQYVGDEPAVAQPGEHGMVTGFQQAPQGYVGTRIRPVVVEWDSGLRGAYDPAQLRPVVRPSAGGAV